MAKETTISASTQYGDWRGSARADDHDHSTLTDYVRARGWMAPDDVIVAWEIYSGEITRQKSAGQLSVTVHFAHASDVGDARKSGEQLLVKSIYFDMSLVDFFETFKRFSVAASRHGEFDVVQADEPVSVK